jgi:glycosyltransferase involved in cell wall biosynthesis
MNCDLIRVIMLSDKKKERCNDIIVSILVPIYNEEKSINVFLESILLQTFRGKFEVLLIDGKSLDKTNKKIKEFFEKHSIKITNSIHKNDIDVGLKIPNLPIYKKFNISFQIIENSKKIVPCALNIGIKQARGDIIIRMDSHTKYDPMYLEYCVKFLSQNIAENIGGPIISTPGSVGYIANAIALASSSFYGVGNSKFRTSDTAQYVDTVPFGAWKKELFMRVGMFDERLARGQDIEMNSRIRKHGGRIYLSPVLKSYYYCHSTLTAFGKKCFENGKWNVYTFAVDKRALSWRHFVPMAFVSSLIVSLIFSSQVKLTFYYFPISFIGFFYFLFCLLASIKVRSKYSSILPIVFLVMHCSYGLGSIWGIFTLLKWFRSVNSTFYSRKLTENTIQNDIRSE